jgi:glycosyltransferase involved in cell wall biosynthesis
MKIHYYSTIPPPVFPGTEAMMKDIEQLMGEFGGEFLNLYPFRSHIPGFPQAFIGMQHMKELRSKDRDADIHHVFLSRLYSLPVLRTLKKPVVCSVVSTVSSMIGPVKNFPYHVVVSNSGEGELLRSRGITRFSIITPGIDTSAIPPGNFSYDGGEFVLFCGSAPWVSSHFQKKGFDLLLDVIGEKNDLRLVCLWRGILYDEFMTRIEDAGVTARVEVINKKVDVFQVLSRAHAGIVLSELPGDVAAFPRSLLESLVAGMPVIASRCMGISEYIASNRCGCVVESFSTDHLIQCIETIKARYIPMVRNANERGRTDFSKERMVDSFRELYSTLIEQQK